MHSFLLFLLSSLSLLIITTNTIRPEAEIYIDNEVDTNTNTEAELFTSVQSTLWTSDQLGDKVKLLGSSPQAIVFSIENVITESQIKEIEVVNDAIKARNYRSFIFLVDETFGDCNKVFAEKIATYLNSWGIPSDESLYVVTAKNKKQIGIYVGKKLRPLYDSKLLEEEQKAATRISYGEYYLGTISFVKYIKENIFIDLWPDWLTIVIVVAGLFVFAIVISILACCCPPIAACLCMIFCCCRNSHKSSY